MSSCQEFILRKWCLKFHRQGKISVEGITEHLPPNTSWKSSNIVERIDQNKVKSSTGSIYHLSGPLDDSLAHCYSIPDEIIRKFRDGFPKKWVELLTPFLNPRLPNMGLSYSNYDFEKTGSNVSVISLRSGRSVHRSAFCSLAHNHSWSASDGEKVLPKLVLFHDSIKNKVEVQQFKKPQPVKIISTESSLNQRQNKETPASLQAEMNLYSVFVKIPSREKSICKAHLLKASSSQVSTTSLPAVSKLRNEPLCSYNFRKRRLSPCAAASEIPAKRLKCTTAKNDSLIPREPNSCNHTLKITSSLASTNREELCAYNLRPKRQDSQHVHQDCQKTSKKSRTIFQNATSSANLATDKQLTIRNTDTAKNTLGHKVFSCKKNLLNSPIKLSDETNSIQRTPSVKRPEQENMLKQRNQSLKQIPKGNSDNFFENEDPNLNVISEEREGAQSKATLTKLVSLNNVISNQLTKKILTVNNSPVLSSNVTKLGTRNNVKYAKTPVVTRAVNRRINERNLETNFNSYSNTNILSSNPLITKTPIVEKRNSTAQTAQKLLGNKENQVQSSAHGSITHNFQTPQIKRIKSDASRTTHASASNLLQGKSSFKRQTPVKQTVLAAYTKISTPGSKNQPAKQEKKVDLPKKQALGKKGTMKRRKQIRDYYMNRAAGEENDEHFPVKMPSVDNFINGMDDFPNLNTVQPCLTPKSDADNIPKFLMPASVKRIYCSPVTVVCDIDQRVQDKIFYAQEKWKKKQLKEAKKKKKSLSKSVPGLSSKMGNPKENLSDLMKLRMCLAKNNLDTSDASMDEYFSESDDEDAFQTLINTKAHLFKKQA